MVSRQRTKSQAIVILPHSQSQNMQRRIKIKAQCILNNQTISSDRDTASYVVNKSLHCALQHKRTSIDIKLFLQLQQKMMRKKKIEKGFNTSLYQYVSDPSPRRKGFIGDSQVPKSFYQTTHRQRNKTEMTTRFDQIDQTILFTGTQHSTISHLQRDKKDKQTMSLTLKPNMNININLFRRKLKRPVLRNDNLCYRLIQNFNKSDQERKRKVEGSSRHKKNYTIS